MKRWIGVRGKEWTGSEGRRNDRDGRGKEAEWEKGGKRGQRGGERDVQGGREVMNG